MPIYDYICEKNPEHKHTETRGINETDTNQTCKEQGCDGNLKRVFAAPPIIFKGMGFSAKRG